MRKTREASKFDPVLQLRNRLDSRCVAIQATALKLGFVSQAEFDEVVDPAKWCTHAEPLDWDVTCILKTYP